MTKISGGEGQHQPQPSLHSPKSTSVNRVKKTSSPGHKLDSVSQEEMQSLLAKLKELVPNMPRNKKLSKLEIIQYVIDYIFDLQLALESHPSTSSPISKSQISSPPLCPSSTSPSNRQPLGRRNDF